MSVTVKDLKEQLNDLPDDGEIVFQGELTFYRINPVDDNVFQLEFNEAEKLFNWTSPTVG